MGQARKLEELRVVGALLDIADTAFGHVVRDGLTPSERPDVLASTNEGAVIGFELTECVHPAERRFDLVADGIWRGFWLRLKEELDRGMLPFSHEEILVHLRPEARLPHIAGEFVFRIFEAIHGMGVAAEAAAIAREFSSIVQRVEVRIDCESGLRGPRLDVLNYRGYSSPLISTIKTKCRRYPRGVRLSVDCVSELHLVVYNSPTSPSFVDLVLGPPLDQRSDINAALRESAFTHLWCVDLVHGAISGRI